MLENIKDVFIKNLVAFRKSAGLTQAQMAEKIGIGLKTYQKYEYKKAFPDIDKIEPIAKALSISEADLFKYPRSIPKTLNNETSTDELIGRIFSKLAALKRDDLNTVLIALDKIIGRLKSGISIDKTVG